MSNKLGHFQNAGSTPVVGRWLPNPDSYGLALMKRNLIVQEDPGQEQESHSPPSRRAAAPRLIPPGCRSGAGSHSIPRGSISSGRSTGHQSLPHPAQTAGRRDTGDACAQEMGYPPPGPTEGKGNNTPQQQDRMDRRPRYVCALPDVSARSRGSTACT